MLLLLPPPAYLIDFHELRISDIFKGFKLVTTHELHTATGWKWFRPVREYKEDVDT